MFAGALVPLLVPSAALVGVSCTDGLAMPDTALEISITTDKTDYAADEPIVLRLEIRNGTDEPFLLEFSTAQRYDFVMDDAEGGTAWRWSADKAFIQVLGEEQLAPGESLTYEERFEGSLTAGTYTVVAILVATNVPLEARTTISVR